MPDGLERIRNARVLVVEDSVSNQTLARDLLLHAGARVDLAGNGREAIEAIEKAQRPYHAVLMDLQMPVMDGLEASRIIRETFSRDVLPIIATTANTETIELERCLQAGANDILPKPFHIHQLYEILVRWLREERTDPAETALDPGFDGAVQEGSGALPKSIAGIDMKGGLARVGNKRELYARLLREFADSHKETGRRLEAAFAAGDVARIGVIVHEIRSTAGNIGADRLSGTAAEIEKAVAVQGDLGELLRDFRKRLKKTVEDIEAAAISVNPRLPVQRSEGGALDLAEVGVLIGSLLELLRDQDFKAQATFERLSEVLSGGGYDTSLAELSEYIEVLDFSTARQMLERMEKEILE